MLSPAQVAQGLEEPVQRVQHKGSVVDPQVGESWREDRGAPTGKGWAAGSEQFNGGRGENEDYQHPANPCLSLTLLTLETCPLTHFQHPPPSWKGRALRCTEQAPHCLFPWSLPSSALNPAHWLPVTLYTEDSHPTSPWPDSLWSLQTSLNPSPPPPGIMPGLFVCQNLNPFIFHRCCLDSVV